MNNNRLTVNCYWQPTRNGSCCMAVFRE